MTTHQEFAVGEKVLYKPGYSTPSYQGIRLKNGRIAGTVIGTSPSGRIRVQLDLDFSHIGGRVQRMEKCVHAFSLIRQEPPA